MADNNSKTADDAQLTANSDTSLSVTQNGSNTGNGNNTESGATPANATSPASVPQSTSLPPIGHLMFSFDMLGDNGEPASDVGFPLHPPMVIPPAIMDLVQHFAQSMNISTPADDTPQTQDNAPLAAPEVPEELLTSASDEIEALIEDVPATIPLQGVLNKYKAPRPDKDTFNTHSEFLESLKPVDIDSLEQNNRRCAICWKDYGEAPDPGLDNSEQPVKLRCSHVYGDKCLRRIFGEQVTTEVKLIPLSFDDPKSRASELGRKLEAFFGSAPASLHEKLVIDALDRVIDSQKGSEMFGKYWWAMFDQLKATAVEVSRVVLKENAVVLEVIPQKQPNAPVLLPWNSMGLHFSGLASAAYDVGYANGAASSAAPPASAPISPAPGLPPSTSAPAPSVPAPTSTFPTHSSTSPGTTPVSSQGGNTAASADTASADPADHVLFPDILDELPAHLLQPLDALMALAEMDFPPVNPNQYMAFLEQKALEFTIRDQQRHKMIALLAKQLKGIYRAYLAAKPSMKNASDAALPTHERFAMWETEVVIHKSNADKSSLNVAPPRRIRYSAAGPHTGEDDDDEIDSAARTLIISRIACIGCFEAESKKKKKLPGLKSVSWNNVSKIPDDCPLCHKVLFRKQVSSLLDH